MQIRILRSGEARVPNPSKRWNLSVEYLAKHSQKGWLELSKDRKSLTIHTEEDKDDIVYSVKNVLVFGEHGKKSTTFECELAGEG